MSDSTSSDQGNRVQSSFLYARSRYYGHFSPQNLAFNANLQEFSQRISLLCSLETGGKLTPSETYAKIEQLWHQLQISKENLGIRSNGNREDT